jgi:hypothetical protein
MFSALVINSSSAKARICLRLTPGWRAKAVSDQLAGIQLDLDLVFGLAHLHTASNPFQQDLPVGVERDITFHVHHALV